MQTTNKPFDPGPICGIGSTLTRWGGASEPEWRHHLAESIVDCFRQGADPARIPHKNDLLFTNAVLKKLCIHPFSLSEQDERDLTKMLDAALAFNVSTLTGRDEDGWTPLHCAVWVGNESLVRAFLAAADRNGISMERLVGAPIAIMGQNGEELGFCAALRTAAGQRMKRALYGATPVHLAARRGNEAILDALLDAEPKIAGWNDAFGRTPIFAALSKNRFANAKRIVRALVESDGIAALYRTDVGGRAPLSAVIAPLSAVIMLDSDRDMEESDGLVQGLADLVRYMRHSLKNASTTDELLEAFDRSLDIALFDACLERFPDLVEAFLKGGADPEGYAGERTGLCAWQAAVAPKSPEYPEVCYDGLECLRLCLGTMSPTPEAVRAMTEWLEEHTVIRDHDLAWIRSMFESSEPSIDER